MKVGSAEKYAIFDCLIFQATQKEKIVLFGIGKVFPFVYSWLKSLLTNYITASIDEKIRQLFYCHPYT